MAEYIAAKQRIYQHARVAVVNREEAFAPATENVSYDISFGMMPGEGRHFGVIEEQQRKWIACGDDPWIACDELSSLPGISGILNAQAALAIGYAVGLPKATMIETLKTFEGLPHRMQSLGEVCGVEWINDSKATNVAATCAALATIKKPSIWIAGGDGKDADFSHLLVNLGSNLKFAFLIGRDAALIEKTLQQASVQFPFETVADLETAVQKATECADTGDCILLSPACSSLDAYTNYIERGNHFMQLFQEQTCTTG